MNNHDETSIMALLRNQSSLEYNIAAGNLTVLIRTRDTAMVPIEALEADPETDDSVVVGG